MYEYEKISCQTKSKESLPRQRKKAVDVKDQFDRDVSFPTYRKKTMWEEDTDQSYPVQLQPKKEVQRSKPQPPKPQRRKPQPVKLQPGNQDRVQKLIEKIYITAHTEPLDGRIQEDEDTLLDEDVILDEDTILGKNILDDETDERKRTLSEKEQIWLKDIDINGLCGGWAILHRANPETFAAIWTALACWNGNGSIARHMDRYCELSEPGMGWENYIISLADSAVGIMKALEPKAGYKTLSDGIAEGPPEFDIKKALNNPNKKRVVHVDAEGAGEVVYDCIVKEPCLKDKHEDPHVIHMETDKHHMSVRTRFIDNVVRIEEIVESEYAGVVLRPDQRTAEYVLEHGIYLDRKEETIPYAQNVELFFYNAKKVKSDF